MRCTTVSSRLLRVRLLQAVSEIYREPHNHQNEFRTLYLHDWLRDGIRH
jgi:hypothetical protein